MLHITVIKCRYSLLLIIYVVPNRNKLPEESVDKIQKARSLRDKIFHFDSILSTSKNCNCPQGVIKKQKRNVKENKMPDGLMS